MRLKSGSGQSQMSVNTEKGTTSKVLVTDNISEEGIKKLQEFGDVDVEPDLNKEDLAACIADYDALVIRSGTTVTKEIIDAGKRLKVIGRAGVCVDNIDVERAT